MRMNLAKWDRTRGREMRKEDKEQKYLMELARKEGAKNAYQKVRKLINISEPEGTLERISNLIEKELGESN